MIKLLCFFSSYIITSYLQQENFGKYFLHKQTNNLCMILKFPWISQDVRIYLLHSIFYRAHRFNFTCWFWLFYSTHWLQKYVSSTQAHSSKYILNSVVFVAVSSYSSSWWKESCLLQQVFLYMDNICFSAYFTLISLFVFF